MPNSQFTHHFNWMSLKANAMHALSRLMLPKFLLKVKHINCTKYWGSLGLFHKCVRYNLIIFTHQFPSLPSHGSLSSLFHLSLFFKKSASLHEREKCAIVKPGLFHWTQWLPSPSTFLQTIWPYCLLWLSDTPLGTSSAFPLFVHLPTGAWTDSVTWLPWIMLPWTWMYRHCCCLWLWLGIHPRVCIKMQLNHMATLLLVFWDTYYFLCLL